MPVAKDPFICPECGVDTFKVVDYDKKVREERELRDRFKRALADHGKARAEWIIREIELDEGTRYLQRKVLKQAKALHRLEEKLKARGQQPYKELRA